MGDQGLSASIPSSFNGFKTRVQGDHDPVQSSAGVTDLQTDIVPIFSQFRSIKLMNKTDQVLYALSLLNHLFLSVLSMASRKKSAAWFLAALFLTLKIYV